MSDPGSGDRIHGYNHISISAGRVPFRKILTFFPVFIHKMKNIKIYMVAMAPI